MLVNEYLFVGLLSSEVGARHVGYVRHNISLFTIKRHRMRVTLKDFNITDAWLFGNCRF